MTTKHSPGPWTFQEHGSLILDARTGSSQCAVAHVQVNTYKDEGMHNARLIAAAPDLLSALVEAVDLIETISPMEGDTLRRARAAIAKAVGHNAPSSADAKRSAGMTGYAAGGNGELK